MYTGRKDSDEVIIPFHEEATSSFLLSRKCKEDCAPMTITGVLIGGSLVLVGLILWALISWL